MWQFSFINTQKFVFFFKQKTAYEIYQCDWSSDVCSSDLFILVAIKQKIKFYDDAAS